MVKLGRGPEQSFNISRKLTKLSLREQFRPREGRSQALGDTPLPKGGMNKPSSKVDPLPDTVQVVRLKYDEVHVVTPSDPYGTTVRLRDHRLRCAQEVSKRCSGHVPIVSLIFI